MIGISQIVDMFKKPGNADDLKNTFTANPDLVKLTDINGDPLLKVLLTTVHRKSLYSKC